MEEKKHLNTRDFNTISPSAKSLLLLKGYTDIPFARQAAEIALAPEKYIPDYNIPDRTFWARMIHFENRYKSIDYLMEDIKIKNILELSSGFSFRGLDMIKQKDIHYIDTDLPELIETKTMFLEKLEEDIDKTTGKLETLPLNVLDENQFEQIVQRFPDGEVLIINEGLLVYLDKTEKEKLCSIIRRILQQRGGYWITADIYIKKEFDRLHLRVDEKTKAFLEQHNVEENKFESFEDAEIFFKNAGFIIDKIATVDRSRLNSVNWLLQNIPEEQVMRMRETPRIQSTWRLKL